MNYEMLHVLIVTSNIILGKCNSIIEIQKLK